MNTFFDNNNKSDIGKLIHVGAGNGIEVNDYAAQSFTEILLLFYLVREFIAKAELPPASCSVCTDS